MLAAMEMDLETLAAKLEVTETVKERRALTAKVAREATPDDLAGITRLLGHAQGPVRTGAVEILAVAQFRPALKHLAAVTVQKTGDEQVLAARAVTMLARPGDGAALEKLARTWLARPDHLLKDCGAKLLVKLGVVATEAQAEKTATEPAGTESPAIPGAGITARDGKLRRQAIERTITEADDPQRLLVDALLEKQPPGVPLDLVAGLARLGDEKLSSAALELLPRVDGTVVALLARALVKYMNTLPDPQVAALREALDLARRRLYGEALVAEAVEECLRTSSP